MTSKIEQQIESMAASCGCNSADLGFLLKSIVSQIETDKATEAFQEADDAMRSALTEAYLADAGRKMERLTTHFLTNTQSRDDLHSWMFDELKAEAELKQEAA